MNDSTMHTVSQTFTGVVEQLTFMFGEDVDKGELDTEGVAFTSASMTFAGDIAGTVTLVVPTAILGTIAANILGVEPEDISPNTVLADSLGEMLNVICGHLIMDLQGESANFVLGPPRTVAVDGAFVARLCGDDAYLGFLLDDSPVFLGLQMES